MAPGTACSRPHLCARDLGVWEMVVHLTQDCIPVWVTPSPDGPGDCVVVGRLKARIIFSGEWWFPTTIITAHHSVQAKTQILEIRKIARGKRDAKVFKRYM